MIKGEDGDDKEKWEHLLTSVQGHCVYNSSAFLWDKETNNKSVYHIHYMSHHCVDEVASDLPQKERDPSPEDFLSSHSFPLSISYHLFLSCTKPDESHLTNLPIEMQKCNLLAAP